MQSIPSHLTADDIVPLIAALTPQERTRLLCLIVRPHTDNASAYQAMPPSDDEFSSDEEPLAWDGQDWENVA